MPINYRLTDYTVRLQDVRFLQLDLELSVQCPISVDEGQSTMTPRCEPPIDITDVKDSLVLESHSSHKLLEGHDDFTHRSTRRDLVTSRPEREGHYRATLERMLWRHG